MAESIREQILSAIETQLSATYRVSGEIDDDELPLTVFQDGDDTSSDTAYGETEFRMPVAVGMGKKISSTDEKELRKAASALQASIIQLMFVDETFGGLADGIEVTDSGILIEPGNRCMAEAQFTVRYTTLRGDPFNKE